MLERIREGSQGIAAKTVLGLVILTFAISGIGSYINSKADASVATVNGVEISKSAFDQAYQNGRARLQSQFGEMAEQLLADESYIANFRKSVLDRLVVEELQQQQAKDLGIRVSDEQIRKAIREMPQFQQAGEFNNDIYLASLRQAGFRPNQFRDYLRQQMALSQYSGAIMGSEFVLPSEESKFAALNNQVRGFDLLTIETKAVEAQVTVEDADLETYYQNNILRYQTQEKIAVEYIELSSDTLSEEIVVSEDELKTYYEENRGEFSQPEKRRIAHILIESGEGSDAKLAQVKAKLDAGEAFDAIAKELSDDSFSAENGGDLEYFEAGIFGDSFDTAVLALANVNDITGSLETESGVHFIKLTELEPELVTPFEQVKDTIAKNIKESKAVERYIEAQTRVTEVAFEVPDSLEEASKESGIELKTQPLASRYQLAGSLANPKVASKMFDPDFIAEGLNSELIEIDDKTSIVARITEHEASRQQSLDEVKSQVTAAVKQQKASELALQKVEEAQAKLLEGISLAELAKEFSAKTERFDDVTRTDNRIDSTVREKTFAMAKPADNSVETSIVEMGQGNAALVVLNKVTVPETDAEQQQASRIASIVGQLSANSLIEAAKANADIEQQ